MDRLWFKSKRYGWGWYPVTKEGWLVLLCYVVLFIAGELWFIGSLKADLSLPLMTAYIAYILLITGLLIWICYKTGERPRWRWGK